MVIYGLVNCFTNTDAWQIGQPLRLRPSCEASLQVCLASIRLGVLLVCLPRFPDESEILTVWVAEEPDFSFAMSRYYDDTIACMGALQIVPGFMKAYVSDYTFDEQIIHTCSFVYSLITRKGQALDILLTRMLDAVDPNLNKWEESEDLRSVYLVFVERIRGF